MVRVAHVGVIESEAISNAVVGQLYESPQAVGNFTGVKKAHLLGEEEVPILGKSAADCAVRKGPTGVGIGHLQHQADRRYLIERECLIRIDVDAGDLFDVVQNVAVELKFAAKRGQLGKHRMAGGAGHSGLSGKARYGPTRRK